jgi:hypothetical protein
MDYRDRIIVRIAEQECKRISRKVVLALQKMTDGMQSGDDSGLKNIWDEICVQVQSEQSIMWNLYEDLISDIIAWEVEKLGDVHKQAIWLQTSEGIYWDDDKKPIPYVDQDITDYIFRSYVLNAAADWKNRRIEAYLDRS